MFTPASSVAIGSSRTVTSRAQPPLSSRLCDAANEYLRFGTVPESVRGGVSRSGFSFSTGTLCGPRIEAPSLSRIGSGATPLPENEPVCRGASIRASPFSGIGYLPTYGRDADRRSAAAPQGHSGNPADGERATRGRPAERAADVANAGDAQRRRARSDR